jgi:AraC family transcriptional activator FtrA
MRKQHLVAIVAYDQLCTFEFGCTVELFALRRPELKVPWYDFVVCTAERGPIRAMGGIEVHVPHSLRVLDRADTIVIPGWRSMDETPSRELLKPLRRAFDRGARLCSICSGVFVLAAAGVLDGKRATTHWRYAKQLAERYPSIRVEPNALYVDEGQILTSAGSAAGLDMLIHLVRKDFGSKVANQVAQRLVIPPHRQGGQAQYIPRPVPTDERGRLAKLLDFIRANLALEHTVSSLASRVAMSPRTLQREFKAATGLAPYTWIVHERIERAKELLESSRWPTRRIAELVGLGSVESLRHHFRQSVGTTPADYRARFGRSSLS